MGLVALISYTCVRLMLNYPLTADFSKWYPAGTTVFPLAVILALAGWALYTAIQGRPSRVSITSTGSHVGDADRGSAPIGTDGRRPSVRGRSVAIRVGHHRLPAESPLAKSHAGQPAGVSEV